MKTKVICLIIAVLCVIPVVLTGCSGGSIADEKGTPSTVVLYGYTDKATTDEAILQVQDAMNEYTENKFNVHLELKLYPEDEYDAILEEQLAKGQSASVDGGILGELPDGQTYRNTWDGQVDIFMTKGATHLNDYYLKDYLTDLSTMVNATAGSGRILKSYIPQELLYAATVGGQPQTDGTIKNGFLAGIPNNKVNGEYTYLLINKTLADKYYYAAKDVETLETLVNFLEDVAANDKDYIPLYNEPYLCAEYLTDNFSLIGGSLSSSANMFSSLKIRDMFSTSTPVNYYAYLYDFTKKGYITVGDPYALPEDQKVAAAFIQGDAATANEYEDDYYVVTYANPVARYTECPGTTFCISSYTYDPEVCMKVIVALETNADLRNMFQYGVENVHYTIDPYENIIEIISGDYVMDPADTGNMFLLRQNSSMDEKTLRMSANDWEVGKQQVRDTIYSPYVRFPFYRVTAENYEKVGKVKKRDENGNYPFAYTDTILTELEKLSAEIIDKIRSFDGTDENGNAITVKDYIKLLRKEFEQNEYYLMLTDKTNADAPYTQYARWSEDNLA